MVSSTSTPPKNKWPHHHSTAPHRKPSTAQQTPLPQHSTPSAVSSSITRLTASAWRRPAAPNRLQERPPLPLQRSLPYPEIHHRRRRGLLLLFFIPILQQCSSSSATTAPTPHLQEVRADGVLPLGRELQQQRRDVGAGALEEHLGRGHDARRVLPAQRLGLEGLRDEDEDALGLGGDGGVLPGLRLAVFLLFSFFFL